MNIQNLIAERAVTAGEPPWLQEKRLEAWKRFQEIPEDDTNFETWMRTDISKLNLSEVIENTVTSIEPSAFSIQPSANKGIIFTDIKSAILKHSDIIKKYFLTKYSLTDTERFLSLHTALWRDGVFLYVPSDSDVKTPFHIISNMKGRAGNFPHSIIVLDKGAKTSVIEENYSDDDGSQVLRGGMVEVFIGEGAELNYSYVQNLNMNTYNIPIHRVYVEKDGIINWTQVDIGGRLTKSFTEIILKGRGASSNIYGVVAGIGKQHFDISPVIHHQVEETKGNVLIKGVLSGNARSVFQGLVKIDKEGRKADSYLANHNLILSEGARADTIPKLEIDIGDVSASHGATVGEVDNDQLFYLMSRGLSEVEAREMIVNGFIEPIILKIDSEELREKVRNIIADKLK
jgi:Fe-S cluster assembly protein SufD